MSLLPIRRDLAPRKRLPRARGGGEVKWPTMKTKELVLRDVDRIAIDATVTVDDKCVVAVHFYGGSQDDWHLSAVEAERLAKALNAAAAVTRAKKVAARVVAVSKDGGR